MVSACLFYCCVSFCKVEVCGLSSWNITLIFQAEYAFLISLIFLIKKIYVWISLSWNPISSYWRVMDNLTSLKMSLACSLFWSASRSLKCQVYRTQCCFFTSSCCLVLQQVSRPCVNSVCNLQSLSLGHWNTWVNSTPWLVITCSQS